MRHAIVLIFAFLCRLNPALAEEPARPAASAVDPDHSAKMARGLEVFQKDVRPLLTERCLKCHSGDEPQGSFDLSTREGLLKGGERGPAILTGRGEKSLLVRLAAQQQEPFMPEQGDALTSNQLAALVKWIDLGAPYDRPLGENSANGPKWTERKIHPQARAYWAFRPLEPGRFTPVSSSHQHNAATGVAGPGSPIDCCIQATSARRASEGIVERSTIPSLVRRADVEVDRRTLIRRLSFDLIGLPPSPAEADAFVNNPAPDAYEQLVDRLLSNPHYGERWGRHWLDLARFAESHGFEHDTDRPTAFHYRDYVIQAFNGNQPYDEFVRWQIAGDEFAPDDRLALMATGFLAAGVHSTQITKNEVERHRYDEMDDMLSTIGQAMLGLSIGCARCHDHKFDPIPQADYYRLLSAFTTTVRSEVDLDFDPVGYARAKAEFDATHAPFESAVRDYERHVLPQKLAAWRVSESARSLHPTWLEPNAVVLESRARATFTRQSDGSWLVTGKNEIADVYTVTIDTALPTIRHLRIEALSDPSMKNGGPGRADNGNFALSKIDAEFCRSPGTAVPGSSSSATTPLKFSSAKATFEQVGLPVAAALDDDPKSAWAVDPQFGRDHAAVFTFAESLANPTGGTLVVRLHFTCNARHNIGRLRVSLSGDESPPVNNEAPFRETIQRLLQTAESDIRPEQRAELLDWFKPQDAGWKALHDRRAEHAKTAPQPRIQKVLIASEGLTPVKLHTQAEQEFLPETHFLRRGDPNMKEGVASLGFLQVLSNSDAVPDPWKRLPPPGWRTSYQRTALANWLTDTEYGAGSLLARVIVNRLWQHHLGRGLVATPSDFGTRGEPPTHPELLEWLAAELVRSGWDLKHMHRLIVTSNIYRQQRAPQRLEAEVIRDALLAVTGSLDDRMYGPGRLDDANPRRSVYFTIKRSQLVPMMTVFDSPDGTSSIGERPQTTIAPQALMLMNNPRIRDAASAAAQQLGNDVPSAIRRAYRNLLQRDPTEAELADATAFVHEQATTYQPNNATAALTDLCQVLLCLNEFVYVD